MKYHCIATRRGSFKNQPYHTLVRIWNSKYFRVLLQGLSNATPTSDAILEVTIQPSSSASGNLPKRNENRYPHRDLAMNVHNSFIHGRQNVAAVSSNRITCKQTLVEPLNITLLQPLINPKYLPTYTWTLLQTYFKSILNYISPA